MSDLQHLALSFITHPWLWWPVSCPHAKDITLSDVGGIILSSTRTTPQRWCLRFPMGSRNIPSIPIQLANSRCDPPHVGTTEQENIMQSGPSTENITPSVRGIINNEPSNHGPLFFCLSLGWWSLLRIAQWSSISRRLLLLMSHEVGSVSWGLGGKAVWNHWAMPVEPRAMAAFHMVRSVHLQPTWPTGIIGCDCV